VLFRSYADEQGVDVGPRGLQLWASLLFTDPDARYDFEQQRMVLERLDSELAGEMRVVDRFRLAVLCYQVGNPEEGAERFRVLRDQVRREEIPQIGASDYLKDPKDPSRPEVTAAIVRRVVNDFRGEGEVEAIGRQTVPLRPRYFSPPPRVGERVRCLVRFTVWGPMAVPEHTESQAKSSR